MAGATAREEDAEKDKLKAPAAVDASAPVAEAVSCATTSPLAVSGRSASAGSALSNGSAEKSSYQNFLDNLRHPSTQAVVNSLREFVADFPPKLMRQQAAQRVHEFLLVTTPKLRSSAAFADDASEAKRDAEEHFERFVFTKLHKAIYRTLPVDVEQDELTDRKLQERRNASGGRDSLDPELSKESQEHFEKAAECLKMVSQYQTPKAKMICILNAYRLVEHVVDLCRKPGDEEGVILRRILEALVIEASPANFFSSVEFTAAFRHPSRTTAEERRCLEDFSDALGAATGLTPKIPTLGMGPGGVEGLPLWLEGTGVTFRFEGVEASDLLIGEVHELLGTYHRMASVLHSLANSPPAEK